MSQKPLPSRHDRFFIGILGAALAAFIGCQKDPTPTPANRVDTTPAAASLPSAEPPTASPAAPSAGQAQALQLDKEAYLPGEQMKVTVAASDLKDGAWAGVVPSSVPHGQEAVNDEHDSSFFHINSGKDVLIAPKEPGDYDVRLNSDDQDGVELASVSFKVTEDPNPVKEPKILWEANEPQTGDSELEVSFEVPLDFPADAWIGIVKSDVEHGSEQVNDENDLAYAYLENVSRGKIKLKLPTEPGKYDLRMFDTDNGKEVHSVSFEIVEAP